VLERREDSVATLVALMERNLWLEWDNGGGNGLWLAKLPLEGEEDPGYYVFSIERSWS
jgi:hypothetical protein